MAVAALHATFRNRVMGCQSEICRLDAMTGTAQGCLVRLQEVFGLDTSSENRLLRVASIALLHRVSRKIRIGVGVDLVAGNT